LAPAATRALSWRPGLTADLEAVRLGGIKPRPILHCRHRFPADYQSCCLAVPRIIDDQQAQAALSSILNKNLRWREAGFASPLPEGNIVTDPSGGRPATARPFSRCDP
jgi:hypothetical protein